MKKEILESFPYYNVLDPLLDALGWKGEEQELYNALPFKYAHFNTDEFISVLTSLGFILEFDNNSLEENNIQRYPCVFFNQKEVLLIIKKIGDKYLYFDPKEEKYYERVLEVRSGTFVYFSTQNPLELTLKDKSKNWFPLLMKRFKVPFLVIGITSFALSILYLIAPLFVMLIYSQISIAGVTTNMLMLSIGILIYVLALVFFRVIRSYTLGSISTRLSFILNQEVFRRLLYLPPQISESGSVGRQLSKLKDFNSIVDFFNGPGFVSLFELPFVFILLLVMYLIGGSIALVPLCALAVFILLGFYYFPIVKKFSDSNQNLSSQKNEFMLETFTKVNSIKNYSLQEMWLNKFFEIHEKHIESTLVSSSLNTSINIVSNAVISLSALATIGIGVNNVLNEEMQAGALLASILILWKVLNPLRTLFSLSVQLHRLKSSITQINNFMNLIQEENLKDSFIYYNSLKGKIEFNQVSVRYAQNSFPSLLGVNFKINEFDDLVIFGHEGSGKTSVIKLLMGLVPSQSGRVLIDDMNLKQINPIKLRHQIAYCPEQGCFFEERIIDYFHLANPDIKDEALNQLMDDLGIYHIIQGLPNGIETVINESDNEMFSFNLLRKLNFIHTIISDSNIWVFDTIERDFTEKDKKAVLEILEMYKTKKTIVITTEDPSFLSFASKILWLDRGKTKVFGPSDITLPIIEKKLNGENEHGKTA